MRGRMLYTNEQAQKVFVIERNLPAGISYLWLVIGRLLQYQNAAWAQLT